MYRHCVHVLIPSSSMQYLSVQALNINMNGINSFEADHSRDVVNVSEIYKNWIKNETGIEIWTAKNVKTGKLPEGHTSLEPDLSILYYIM